LEQSPIEAMQHSISYRIWNKLFQAGKSKLTIEYKEIVPADKELIGKSQTIKTSFLINGEIEELEWMFEHGHWKISSYDLDKPLKGQSKEDEEVKGVSKKKKNYNGSPVYMSVDALFTPMTFFFDEILNDNFNLMGIGGAMAINFKDRIALYIRVNSLSINNDMERVPNYLTAASVKYLHANTGAQIYFTPGKVRPYLLIGFNYMKFSETGVHEDISASNKFDKFGPQVGLGINFKIINNLNFIAEGSYNSDFVTRFLYSDSYNDVSLVHITAGISYSLKKK